MAGMAPAVQALNRSLRADSAVAPEPLPELAQPPVARAAERSAVARLLRRNRTHPRRLDPNDLGFTSAATEFRITATIPAKQSSRTEANRAGTLMSPLPRYSGDWTSPPMVLASNGRTRLLVSEAINPQIASARITAMTTRPIHLPVSAADHSGEDVRGISSIRLCDANCATAA